MCRHYSDEIFFKYGSRFEKFLPQDVSTQCIFSFSFVNVTMHIHQEDAHFLINQEECQVPSVSIQHDACHFLPDLMHLAQEKNAWSGSL